MCCASNIYLNTLLCYNPPAKKWNQNLKIIYIYILLSLGSEAINVDIKLMPKLLIAPFTFSTTKQRI